MNHVMNIADWSLIAIEYGEKSPMHGHLSGEIAADDDNQLFYMHDVFIRCYGTDSIKKSCETYLQAIKAKEQTL